MSGCNAEVIEGMCPLGFFNNFDLCDLNQYKHPPFMWTLWYISLMGKVIYDKIQELIDEMGGDGGGGGGSDGGGAAAAPAEPAAAEPAPVAPVDEPPEEAQADEAPPEEEEE